MNNKTLADLLRALPDAALSERVTIAEAQRAAWARALGDADLVNAAGFGEKKTTATKPATAPKPRAPKTDATAEQIEAVVGALKDGADLSAKTISSAVGFDAMQAIRQLIEAGGVTKIGAGRATSYKLAAA